jgi:hypothetical protein
MMMALIDERPLWPHDARPPSNDDLTRPAAYVVEMTAVGFARNAGPEAIVRAVKQGLSPCEFIRQIKKDRHDDQSSIRNHDDPDPAI